jgi:hypothetical protein
VLHAQDYAEDIGVERRGKTFCGLVRDRADLPLGGGVIDRNIETTKSRDGLVNHGANIIFLANVGLNELSLGTQRTKLLDQFLADFIPPAGNGPCTTAQWVSAATRVRASGGPVLLADSQAVCTPTGTGLIIAVTQVRVRGQ